MWYPNKHYREIAEEVVQKEGVHFNRSTSGYNKGDYSAKLNSKKDLETGSLANYYNEKYGAPLRRYSQMSSHDKEQAERYLINDISSELSLHNRKNNPQPLKDIWQYYKKTKGKLEFTDTIGLNSENYWINEIGQNRLDYFNIIDGDINQDNWKTSKFKGSGISNIGKVTTFKELYYKLKSNAKEEHLSENKRLNYDKQYNHKEIKTYVFDEQNISEIKQFESTLDDVKKEDEPTISDTKKQPQGTIKLSDLTDYIPTTDNGHIKIGYRGEFLKTPILLGRERVIVLANNEVHRSIFALVDLDNIIASHNEKTYNDTDNYPTDSKGGNINDRNYADDKNAQHKVRQVAEQFNPEVQISTSATAAGLPIITIDGVVVSGNNRTMSMKLMVSDFAENYTKYLEVLTREVETFGFDRFVRYGLRDNNLDAVDNGTVKFKTPILVRIDLDFPEYNTMEMSKYNKDTKKTERPIDKAIKLGKILESNPACFTLLSDSISRFDTISDLYVSGTEVNKIKTALVSCGILTTNELPAYINNNVFTNAGKEFLENLMAGMILEKDQLIASEMDGVKGLKQIIVQSLTVLVKNAKIEGFSLKEYINDAIMIQQKLVSSKLNMRDLVSQFSLFEDSKFEFTERGCYLNLLLHLGKLKFKKTIERYNESADSSGSASMFGEPTTQQELFDNLITKQLDSKDVEFVKDFFSKKQAPKAKINSEPYKIDGIFKDGNISDNLKKLTSEIWKENYPEQESFGNYFTRKYFRLKLIPITLIAKTNDNTSWDAIDGSIVSLHKDKIKNKQYPALLTEYMIDEYQLYDGFHKLQAYKELLFTQVPCIVGYDNASENDNLKEISSSAEYAKLLSSDARQTPKVEIAKVAETAEPDYKYGIGDLVSFVGIGGEVFYGTINTLGSKGMYEIKYGKHLTIKPESELTFISKVEQVEVEKPKVEVVEQPQEQTKEELEALIKGLEIAYEFDPTEDLDTLIKGLKIALEFKD